MTKSHLKFCGVALFAIVLIVTGASGQTQPIARPIGKPTVPAKPPSQLIVPDISIFAFGWGTPLVQDWSGKGPPPWENLPEDKAYIRVWIENDGKKAIDGPIEVWLRVWKPSKPQNLDASSPEATSYVWGATAVTIGLGRNSRKEVGFVVPRPPGGFEMDCKPYVGCHLIDNGQDPLRLRIVARIDPANKIMESNKANNIAGWFLPIK
jgi:hypothetical protein